MKTMHSDSLQRQEALEAAIRRAVCQFQLEFMAGSFGERIRVLVAPEMIVVRSQGALPAAEQQLIQREEGRALVKHLYHTLFAPHHRVLVNQVAALTGREVTDVVTDVALSTGEQVIVFLLVSHDEG